MSYYKTAIRDWNAKQLEENVVLFSKSGSPCTAILNFMTKDLTLYKGNRLEIGTDCLNRYRENKVSKFHPATVEDALDMALIWVREGSYDKEAFER